MFLLTVFGRRSLNVFRHAISRRKWRGHFTLAYIHWWTLPWNSCRARSSANNLGILKTVLTHFHHPPPAPRPSPPSLIVIVLVLAESQKCLRLCLCPKNKKVRVLSKQWQVNSHVFLLGCDIIRNWNPPADYTFTYNAQILDNTVFLNFISV